MGPLITRRNIVKLRCKTGKVAKIPTINLGGELSGLQGLRWWSGRGSQSEWLRRLVNLGFLSVMEKMDITVTEEHDRLMTG